MLILAELPAPDSGPGIGWLLVGLGAIFLILNQGADFINRFRNKDPDPPLYKEYASRTEHTGLRDEFAQFREEVRLSFDDASQTSRVSREKIYTELRRQAELLATNTAKTELTHNQLHTFDAKLDRLRDLIAQLRLQ